MPSWSPQRFRKLGVEQEVDIDTLSNAISTVEHLHSVNPRLPPIFTLRHLSSNADVNYSLIRKVVERSGYHPYTTFKLKKSDKKNYRIICIPDNFLLKVQRWILSNILDLATPHHASTAYTKNSSILDTASVHCGAKWLIKLDIVNFFESFSEISVYRVFRSLGYQPLISFEMARICTRLSAVTPARSGKRWKSKQDCYTSISAYQNSRLGHLPQGAPTSPMLTNLALIKFDKDVARISKSLGLYYTRYADDLIFSTSNSSFNRRNSKELISKIYDRMKTEGFRPNIAKTRIYTPGSRKIVLGLLVDGKSPKLTREFRAKVRMHLYYLRHPKIGPALHARNRGFYSVMGLRNHVEGLISYSKHVSPELGAKWANELSLVDWGATV